MGAGLAGSIEDVQDDVVFAYIEHCRDFDM